MKRHGRPEGRPSPHAQTPGQGPAFDFRSERLAGVAAPRSVLVIIPVSIGPVVGLVVRLVVAFAAAIVRALLVPVGPPAAIICWGHEGAVGLWHRRRGCWRGQGAYGPDDRPGCNNSKRCQSDRLHSRSSVCASPPRQLGVHDSHRFIRRQIKRKCSRRLSHTKL